MRHALTLTLGALLCQPLTSFADPCTDVVADTVAELRAGADGWWSEDIEGLVRAAAGSACIKAQSRRYQVTDDAVGGAPAVSTAPVPSSDARAMDTVSSSETAAGDTQGNAQGSAQGDGEKEDDGSWSIGGLTIRSMSGSPSQKPYERARQTKQADKDKENESQDQE